MFVGERGAQFMLNYQYSIKIFLRLCHTPEPPTEFGINQTSLPTPYFDRIFLSFIWLPTSIFVPLYGGKSHSPDVNHCVFAVLTGRSPGAL